MSDPEPGPPEPGPDPGDAAPGTDPDHAARSRSIHERDYAQNDGDGARNDEGDSRNDEGDSRDDGGSRVYDDELLAESDDDVVSVRRAARSGAGGVGGTGVGRAGGVGWTWVVAAALVGIVLGVWMAGKPAGPGAAPTVPATAAVPTASALVDAQARRAELEALLAASPDDADAHLELGVILYNLGEADAAKEHWETVILLDPATAEAWYNLGFYYLGQEPPDYTNARIVWDKVVELDPDSELAQVVLNHMSGVFPSDQPTG